MVVTFAEGADRHAVLKALRFRSESEVPLEVIPVGAKVTVQSRGFMMTDDEGKTMSIGGRDNGPAMANTLNRTWEGWVVPQIDRMLQAGEQIPPEVGKVLVRMRPGECDVSFNPAGRLGKIKLKPGVVKGKGEPFSAAEIHDILEIEPPTWDGKPCAYIQIGFTGKQIYIVFDFRPNKTPLTSWDTETKLWFARASGEQILCFAYGHLSASIDKLVKADIPFSIGCPQHKMGRLCKAASQGKNRADLEALLAQEFNVTDWQTSAGVWAASSNWKDRVKVFEDALKCYETGCFGGAVSQLMAQVEGVVMASLVAHGLGLKKGGRTKEWKNVVHDLETHFANSSFGPIREMQASAILRFLVDSSLYKSFAWKKQGPPVSRHACMHGYDTTFGTKPNADRMFMLIDAMFYVLN